MKNHTVIKGALTASLAIPLVALGANAASASPGDHVQGRSPTLEVGVALKGANLRHQFTTGGGLQASAPLTGPDDLTSLGRQLFVAFQNGVGAQGEAAGDGNRDSTVVAFAASGRVSGQWEVVGKIDGMTADPASGRLIATVNEDGNSSLYVIDPGSGSIRHYSYDQNVLPHNGGTDAISFYGDRILISASAPGTPSSAHPNPPGAPQAAYPAVYSVSLNPQTLVASVSPLFSDTDTATAANGPDRGKTVTLGLTDPDSNEVVASSSPRFAGDFALDSQGDQQQVFVSDPGGPAQQLSVLNLDQSIDDAAWATAERGALYATDSKADSVDVITGRFEPGAAFVAATPCSANSAPTTCTAANFLGTLDLGSGHVSPVALKGPSLSPGGLIFLPAGQDSHRDQD